MYSNTYFLHQRVKWDSNHRHHLREYWAVMTAWKKYRLKRDSNWILCDTKAVFYQLGAGRFKPLYDNETQWNHIFMKKTFPWNSFQVKEVCNGVLREVGSNLLNYWTVLRWVYKWFKCFLFGRSKRSSPLPTGVAWPGDLRQYQR